ncbi:MAG TPA: glycoside hydrolase family 99-like domain-containing protein, partial [Terriglobia bacterium]|nr:glycoside hydrolase family 99-like domain-containing protein [Terriglobia bacterium]
LDIACGEGYGSYILATAARSVVGVDIDPRCIQHATRHYSSALTRFVLGACDSIPLENDSVDVVVSFETIEHHDRHAEMLDEVKRVLRPDGILIISSPDKREYNESLPGANPFHVKELDLDEFIHLLRARFREVACYGQRIHYGSVVAPIGSALEPYPWMTFGGNAEYISATPGTERPMYCIAVATDASLVQLPCGIFPDPESVLRRDRDIIAWRDAFESVAQFSQLSEADRNRLAPGGTPEALLPDSNTGLGSPWLALGRDLRFLKDRFGQWSADMAVEQKSAIEAQAGELRLLKNRLDGWNAAMALAEEQKAAIEAQSDELRLLKDRLDQWSATMAAEQKAALEAHAAEIHFLKDRFDQWSATMIAEQKAALETQAGELRFMKAGLEQWAAAMVAEHKAALEAPARDIRFLKNKFDQWNAAMTVAEERKAAIEAYRERQWTYSAEIKRWREAYDKGTDVARELDETIRQHQITIGAQEQTIENLKARLSQSEQAVADLSAHLSRSEGGVAELRALIHGVSTSASWRLTAPLRWTKRVASQLDALPRWAAGQSGRLPPADPEAPLDDDRSAPQEPHSEHEGSVFADTPISANGSSSHGNAEFPPPTEPAPAGSLPPAGIAFEPVDDPLVSIIVAGYNKAEYSLACLASIHAHLPASPFEVIFVDDGSTDETERLIGPISGLRYLRNPANIGFLRSANRGASVARGKYLHFLNNDTEIRSGAVDRLVDAFRRGANIAMVGSKLVYPSGHLQEAGAILNADGSAELVGLGGSPDSEPYNFLREVEYCSGASLMIDRAWFEALGGFDSAYAPAYFEDADLALRARERNGRILYQPESLVFHHLSVTTNTYGNGKLALIDKNKSLFLERWQNVLNENNHVRLIAFYLPQFHRIPENDQWWGEGFTEWVSVRTGQPNFEGHYQPHVPDSLGYYDLRSAEARAAQAQLAREHAIFGFCYYHYWFNGRQVLQAPLADVLKSKEPQFPFCVCWANETWSRRWDGQDNEVLIEQTYSPEDDIAFIRALFPYFADPRYIRVNGRPLLLVYRVEKLPNPACTAERWRQECLKAGLPEPYLVRVCSFQAIWDSVPPSTYGFDAAVEFPPHGLAEVAAHPAGLNEDFRGALFDYARTAERFRQTPRRPYPMFKTVMPSWDNTARRKNHSHIFVNSDPRTYENWLREVIHDTRRFAVGDERMVFINAWNEWGEGNHLEPDVRYGTAYLESTKRAWEDACGLKAQGTLFKRQTR